MWINTLYLWPVICSKNPCSRYLLFRWGSSRRPAPGHTACLWKVRTRYGHVTTHLIYYPILPGTLKISVTAESFWMQCPTCITSLSPELTWAPKAHRVWVWVSLNQIHGVSSNNIQFPKHPLGVRKSILFRYKIWGVSRDSACWGLKTVLNSDDSEVVVIWQSS